MKWLIDQNACVKAASKINTKLFIIYTVWMNTKNKIRY
jgi:hypothetical protein